jgi:thiol:disulfide interchange protein DsbD
MKFLLSALFSFIIITTNVQAQEPERYVTLSLITESAAIAAGESIAIGLREDIYPGWHVYWKNPGDSGEPTRIEWILPKGFSISEAIWPAPEKLPFGPLTNYGHEEELILIHTLTAPDNFEGGPVTIRANVDLLVCHEICIPESGSVSLTLNAGGPAHEQILSTAKNNVPLPVGWDASFKQAGEDLIVTLTPDDPSLFEGARDFALFPEEWGLVDNTATASMALSGDKLIIAQARGLRPLSEVPTDKMVLTYTDGHGGADGRGKERAIHFSALNENGGAVPIAYDTGLTFLTAILFALIGGLILNLMPCVFPVLSMKALSLANMKDKEERKIKINALAYTLGVLACFMALATLLIVLKAGGAQIGWGFQLQNPVMITVLAYVVFLIGLNLAGFFEFGSSFAGFGQHWSQKDGAAGAFFTGVLAAVVATPCTAPFMAGAIGYAVTQNAGVALAVFFALGFGLALPYLLLGFLPAARHILPKPGAWMAVFRQLLSFPMFATAAWLVWVLSQQTGAGQVFLALQGFVGIAFALWLNHRKPATGWMRWLCVALIGLIIAALMFTLVMPRNETMHAPDTRADETQNWSSYTPQALEQALSGPYPVFVNMTAAWCITCKVNEQVALVQEEILAGFARDNIVYLKGDWTNRDNTITAYLEQFGRNGVPLYVFYAAPDAQTGQRPDPVILPQILTPGIVKETLDL